MTRVSRTACLAVLLLFLFAGCVAPSHRQAPNPVAHCVHPYPCADAPAWPATLKGPFEPGSYQHLAIPSFDGVVLDGGMVFPALPAGMRFPTVLLLTPYVGVQNQPGDTPAILDYTFDAPVRKLVEAGFAYAVVSVRGTGNSGGCFGYFQPDEQRDAAVVVDWLANQTWSNGRIGMVGVSYPATEALMAAVANPPALKTIVVSGTAGDPYLRMATPQGAMFTPFVPYEAGLYEAQVSVEPPRTPEDPQYMTDHVAVAANRLCSPADRPDELVGEFTDGRDAAAWNERRLTDRFPNVTAATWYVQGLADTGLGFTDDLVWSYLEKAPKRMLTGPWAHELPDGGATGDQNRVEDFADQLVAWLDYWLKGVGAPAPRLGVVDYGDSLGGWHSSTAWPPAEARHEALAMAGGSLAAAPDSSSQSFRSIPRPGPHGEWALNYPGLVSQPYDPATLLCPEAGAPDSELLYATAPAQDDVRVAGNPYAYLLVTADQPGGLVTLNLFDVAPDFSCTPTVHGARASGFGAADLRFHTGTFQGRAFPVDTPTWVRIDSFGIAERILAGHRLVAVLSFGDPTQRHGQPYAPLVTVDGSSFLDLPLVEGTFGGSPPTIEAPPRPFQPPGFPRVS